VKLSANGKRFLKSFEDFRSFSYYDTNPNQPAVTWQPGTLTIGYGFTNGVIPVYIGQTMTIEEANSIFDQIIKYFETGVNNKLQVSVNQNQFDALVSHYYNTGVLSSTIYQLINSGADLKTIGDFWVTHYITAQGFVGNVQGLINRREAEWQLYQSNGLNWGFIWLLVLAAVIAISILKNRNYELRFLR